ncbi:Glycosyltransferase involved in cell wall bisynthesis [Pseudobutyrivibrio sp. 49]|uniref:glycosyltransferase n=1 Tax=Pseudobutyrivibrio sp. 49 TaxID=1855344 RepID=UPI00088CE05D|nr:glycosyltransferase [Pseudobutyrivibrio sp. 49]SDH61688.1 Glycosyltransferase involved in cell wall bisynthesis [Pseudobutyrivibrio sp. 49]
MINVVCGVKSTGRICTDLAVQLEQQGHEVKIAYGRDTVPPQYERFAVRIGSNIDVKMHGLKARLFDGMGLGSITATEKFIEWVREYDPDVIHLHNIHGYYINVPVLFEYLRTCGKRIIWTMHDCWAFTGHCTYFDFENCNRWLTGCGGCPQKGVYPVLWGADRSAENFKLKRNLFTGLQDLTLVTPSLWLEKLVKASYMRQYPIQTIHNGVDTSIFKPTKSDIHEKLGLVGKKIILGVAAVWDRRKGLDDFIQLSELVDDSYAIVLVGLKEKQIEKLPEKIIGIRRTDSVAELVELYSAAYVFVNPTYEDNYPTTNLEAIACGTPVITYNTGGSPESANEYGITLKDKNANAIYDALSFVDSIPKSDTSFSNEKTIEEYLALYKEIL